MESVETIRLTGRAKWISILVEGNSFGAGAADCEKAMLTNNFSLSLDPDVAAYLRVEAERRGVSIEEVYEQEIAAKTELARTTPSNEDLLKIADRSPAPQAWYDE